MQMRRSRNVIFNERGAFNRKRRLIFVRFTRPGSTLRCARRRISTWPYNFVSSRSFAFYEAFQDLSLRAENSSRPSEKLSTTGRDVAP